MASYRDTLDRIIRGDYDDATDDEKNEAVRDAIKVCAVTSAAIAVQPFPFVDVALLAPVQIALVQAMARIHGYKLDKKSVLEVLSTFGASLLAQGAILTAVKFIPFLGWVIGMSMAYALTHAIGEVSDYYFRNGRGIPSDELRKKFDEIYRNTRASKQSEHKADSSLKDKLEQLKEAKADGLLTDEEFEQKKSDILASF